MKNKLAKLGILSVLTALGLGLAPTAQAVNPASFIEVYPSDDSYRADKGLKTVRFDVEVTLDGVAVDVWSISPSTSFSTQAFVSCLGQAGQGYTVNGAYPLSLSDDLRVDCPVWTRGDAIQGGLGIN
jgi:hypothetical protein